MLELGIQCGAGRVGLVLRDLRAVIVSLFGGLFIQEIFGMIPGPRREVGNS